MGKKKPKQEVVKYAMSIHFGICAGPVEYLSRIFIEEKPAWPKLAPAPWRDQATYLIDQKELFGGYKKEGGVEGHITWLPGIATQVMPEVLAAKHGRTSATMPAYRGIASIFFTGRPGDDMKSFYWRANSPYLPGVWCEVARASEALEIPHARIWRATQRRIVHIAIENNATMEGIDGVRGATVKTAVNTILDAIGDFIQAGILDLDIQLSTFGIIGSSSVASAQIHHVTLANVDTLKAYVDDLAFDASDANWDYVSYWANDWFPQTVAETSTGAKRVFILVASHEPARLGALGSYLPVAQDAAAAMADILSRDGGSFNTTARTAVDCYGINVDLADTTYTAYLDNTPGDGVPIVSGADPEGLVNTLYRMLELEGAYDSNPAHIIYECLTNPNWGMGSPAAAIDEASFLAAAETLYEERFGLSMIWTQSGAIEDFIGEVLDHIEATLFVNPRTGLLTLKLIRFDYDVATLPVFTPDNSTVTNFSRKLWGETINEIVVTWTNPDNEEEESVVAQDLANIESQGGVISDGRNYYGVRRPDLAMHLAHRDLRSASTPLAKCDIEINRIAWDLLPGDCCKLNSPEDDIDSIVMRVGPVDYGKPGDSTVRVSLMEDVFSLALADYSEPPDSEWVDTSEVPSPADYAEIITLPYYVIANGIDAAALEGVDYPEVFAGILAAESGQDTDTFQLYGQATDAAGGTSYTDFGTKRISSRATLTDPLVAEVETTILAFPDRTQGNGPVTGGLMILQGADEAESEICLVSDISVSGYTFTRGVLDTVPRARPAGTPVWFVDDSMNFIDDVDIRAEGETVNYKLLTNTSMGTLPEEMAPVVSETMTARPHLPLRPADVKVNGDDGFAGAVDVIGVDPIPVAWARRNRETETALIKAWDDGDVTPEAGQTTVIEVLDPDGTSVVTTHSGLSGTSYNVPAASFSGNPSGWIRVGSERDGLRELQAYAIQCILVTPIDVTAATTGMALTAAVGGVTAGPPTDPYWSSVVLLCGFNGADGSTTIVDESSYAHTLGAVGNAQIDTAQSQFGGSSLLLDGNGDRTSTADSADWNFGNGAFTVEAFVRFAVTETRGNYLASQWDTSNIKRAWAIQYASNAWSFRCTTNGTNSTLVTITNAWTQSSGTWFHFACTRDSGGDVRMFIDGTQIGTTQAANVTIYDSDRFLWIGAIESSTPALDFNGHIDELRITKGVARYTANFTVPTSAFPRG